MKIRGLSELVNEELEKCILNDKTVVVDGQNFFHNLFDKSWMPFIFGTESDRYAAYLRNYLMKYKQANVKCYFVLSGHVDIQNPFKNKPKNDFINSIFQADIFMQILESMNFEYVLCHTNAKNECIALARKLSCPIISFDIDYVFSGIDYIPYTQNKSNDLIIYDESTGNLQCGIFKLNNFLEKYKITKIILAKFIVLTDEDIYPKLFLNNFFKTINLPLDNKERIHHLLTYLSENHCPRFKLTVDRTRLKQLDCFNKYVKNAYKYLVTERAGEITNLFLTLGSESQIKKRDELWFQKGILLKYIAIPYINLFLHNTLITLPSIEDNGQENAIKFSLDIIKYAHDLLKNFDGRGIIVRQKSDASKTSSYVDPFLYSHSIAKPAYEADICVFENGWHNIRILNLFQHFITQTIPPFDFIELEVAPEDARLLIIALVYFARKKKTVPKNVSFSILLSYVMLGVVMEADHDSPIKIEAITNKAVLESITDVTLVTKEDCVTAKYLMKDYFTYTHSEAKTCFDSKVLQLLVEFQYCLQHFNYLNKLCGYPFKPTIYEKTYNGTFVYKILRSVKQKCFRSIFDTLNSAATVLAFFKGLIEVYQAILYDTDASN